MQIGFSLFFCLSAGMQADIDAKIAGLVGERKEAKRKALELEREIKKQKKDFRSVVRKVRGLTSAQLSAAAERAKILEDAASAGAAPSG